MAAIEKPVLIVYELTLSAAYDPDLIFIDGLYLTPRGAALAANRYLATHLHTQIRVRDILRAENLRNGARFDDHYDIKIRERLVK